MILIRIALGTFCILCLETDCICLSGLIYFVLNDGSGGIVSGFLFVSITFSLMAGMLLSCNDHCEGRGLVKLDICAVLSGVWFNGRPFMRGFVAIRSERDTIRATLIQLDSLRHVVNLEIPTILIVITFSDVIQLQYSKYFSHARDA